MARQLVRAGVRLGSIHGVFVTHQHSDHTADYGNLLLLNWATDLATRVDPFVSAPLIEQTRQFLAMNAPDIRISCRAASPRRASRSGSTPCDRTSRAP